MSLSRDDRVLLLHNPRCSKSRAALTLLEESGASVDVRPYLDEPLSADELAELRRLLDRPAIEWTRRGEAAYREEGLAPDSDDAAVLAAMARHPILLERPIAVHGGRAVVGRPPQRIAELLEEA